MRVGCETQGARDEVERLRPDLGPSTGRRSARTGPTRDGGAGDELYVDQGVSGARSCRSALGRTLAALKKEHARRYEPRPPRTFPDRHSRLCSTAPRSRRRPTRAERRRRSRRHHYSHRFDGVLHDGNTWPAPHAARDLRRPRRAQGVPERPWSTCA